MHLQIDMRTDVQPNYVVEGRLIGSELPDEWVVLGNHHDAWVFGGVDPSSGTASMMELTKSLGRLKQKAVAYLNVDSSASGPRLDLSAVGSLAPMVVELTKELRDPSGAYHSAYDSHYWVNQIGDPGYRYHQLMTGLWGSMAWRLANAESLPIDVESYAASVRDFVRHLEEIAGERVAIDADSPYETFSVIKVPLMAAVLDRVREGRLSLSDRITLTADQRRIPSGVLYALDAGLQPTVKDLLTLMIIISDNEATDALGDLVVGRR